MLDSGDLFFARPRLDEGTLLAEMIRAQTIVEGFNLIGTDAITIGEKDLAAGLPFLKALADSARFPMLSATLVDGDGNLIFDPYTIVEKGGLKIGVVGASSHITPGDGYRSLELLPTLEGAVKEVRDRSDMVILLFHGTDQDRRMITASGLPIDLILQSHVQRYDPDFGSEPIPASALGNQGKYINLITVTLKAPGQPLVDLTRPRRTLTFAEKSLQRLRRNQPKETPLEELYADNPRILTRIQDLYTREAEARKTIETALNTIESERISLSSSVKDDQELLGLVNAAKRAIEDVAGATTRDKAG